MSLQVCRLYCGEEVGTLWPKPVGDMKFGNELVRLDPTRIRFSAGSHRSHNSYWQEIENRFISQVNAKIPRKQSLRNGGTQLDVKLEVHDEDTKITLDTDESYKLTISVTGTKVNVKVEAKTYFGARHAIETLSQFIVYDNIRNELQIVGELEMTDKPAYKYRGLVLDTSRNYFPIDAIKRTIDGMAMVKLNTFHWHITDSHSFPLVIKSQPDLANLGAYSPQQIYTREDVADIMHYAHVRGIRVLPEFDAPAHVGEGWQKKDLTACFNAQPWQNYCVEPPCGQLDPSKDELYNVLEDIYREMFEMFSDIDLFHMGGDEVSFACWNSSDSIKAWMKEKQWELDTDGYMKLWNHFQENALQRLDKVSPKSNIPIVMWTSKLTKLPYLDLYLNKDRYIIQVWTMGNDPEVIDLLDKGYNLILSNYDSLYLDCGFAGWVTGGNNWCSPFIGWQKVYDNRPGTIAGKYLSQIYGAEAALWTEQVDEYSLDTRLWPRLSALAERLWSDPSGSWKDAESRMLIHRERLTANGIGASTLEPKWCLQNDGNCPL